MTGVLLHLQSKEGKEAMEYLVTAKEMKEYDRNTIEKIGIPAAVLMERAALSVWDLIRERMSDIAARAVTIVAGMGNNGADGLALARLLSCKGYPVVVYCAGDPARASSEWRRQYSILQHYSVRCLDVGTDFKGISGIASGILVDALFGVGLSRDVEGLQRSVVEAMNNCRAEVRIALDIPSGIDSDSGVVRGIAVEGIDYTVTFGFCKRGLRLYPGCRHCGVVILADIGIDQTAFLGQIPQMVCFDTSDRELLPQRDPYGNKGTFGKVLLLAGSKNMAGAALLAAKSAYRTGAGMVRLITASENRVIVQESIPEVLLAEQTDLEESLQWCDVVAIGPGLGKSDTAKACLKAVLQNSDKPLLIDADGLNLLAEEPDLPELLSQRKRPAILTPHVGELKRLLHESEKTESFKILLHEKAKMLAHKLHTVVVAKDAVTCICAEDHPICVNASANSGMATAGSGDVLAGVIAGLLAQGLSPYEAACKGVRLHALAGGRAVKAHGEHGCMAGDIADHLI